MNTAPHRKLNIYFLAVVIMFMCAGTSLVASRILIDSRILRPNWFTDWFVNPSEYIAKWLENPTCEVPCWEKIIPGETSRDQAKSLLLNNSEITGIEESNVIPYGQVLDVNLDNDNYTDDVTIIFDNQNMVQEIDFATFGDNLYLGDMISVYGPPKQVLLHDQMYEYVTVDLLYPELGMIIELFIHNLNLEGETPQVKIEKYGEILHVYLDAPGLKYFFDTSGVVDPNLSYEWKGYTTYP